MLVFGACGDEPKAPQPAPSISVVTSVTPLAGFPGVEVTITGENLDKSPSVLFGDKVATLVSITDKEIIATVPPLAVSGPVSIQLTDTTIAAGAFKMYEVYALVNETINLEQKIKVWHNGTITFISQGTSFKAGYGLFVDGADFYVSGWYEVRPAYWKNTTYTSLSASLSGRAMAIVVEGGVVHMAGMEINGSQFGVKYWINENGTFLTTPQFTNNDYAGDMEIKNGEVFIAGSESISNGASMAAYWVDGVKTGLSSLSDHAGGEDIFIDTNGDVYVVGFLSATPYPKVVYWKNGAIHEVTDGTTQNFANGIARHDGVVYVIGYGFISGLAVGRMWRDDTPQNLGGTRTAIKLQIVDGDFFILCNRDNANESPAVWFNGRLVNLTAAEANAYATDLVVKSP